MLNGLDNAGILLPVWNRRRRPSARLMKLVLPLTVCGSIALGVGIFSTGGAAPPSATPSADRYVDIATVTAATAPAPGAGASTGTFTVDCGRNESGHYNADNIVISPGTVGGARHRHDYVGNVSTSALSTNESLAAAGTTCAGGDRSTYYWPVLRRLDRAGTDTGVVGGGVDGNTGEIVKPSSVRLEFRGSPVTEVIAMPRFLRSATGDPVGGTEENSPFVRAQWGCSDDPERFTAKYPLCPKGSALTRTFDFPGCWDGLSTDSPNHRTHMAFPAAGGDCPPATFPVPQLRITVTYDGLPPGTSFALDSFPEQRRDPRTDHAMLVNVMTDDRMAELVSCLNEGRHCQAA